MAGGALARRLALVLVLGGTAILSLGDVVDPDLWGHVRYGQDVLATGTLPRSATHSFTAVGHPWVNHENLSEIAFALIVNAVGAPGLLALKSLLGFIVIGLMVHRGQRAGVRLPLLAVVITLVAYALASGWSLRPQLFSYMLFAALISLLDRALARPDRPRLGLLWLTPLLFVVWANTHGAFVAGWCVLAAYVGGHALELLVRRGSAALRPVATLIAVVVASGAATLATPYGPALLTWLAHSLAAPRPEISEWAALGFGDPRVVPFALLAALAVRAAMPRGSARLHPIRALVLAVVAWQAMAHVRHLPFFAIVCGLWLPEALVDHAGSRAAAAHAVTPAAHVPFTLRAASNVLVVALIGFLVVRAQALPVDPRVYPVDALAFMAEHNLTGRLVVHFDWAQYALAAFPEETTVAFDGRFDTCYPPEVVDMHFDFLLGDAAGNRQRLGNAPLDRRRVLDFDAPDLALVSRRYPEATALMHQTSDWVLLYADPVAELWGRRARYDDASSPDFVAPAARRLTAELRTAAVAWPALPPGQRAAEGLARRF